MYFIRGVYEVNSKKKREAFFQGTIIWSSERRVYGGCLGVSRRRRPWPAAKIDGEEQTSIDPLVAEWGNPAGVILLSIIE